MELLTHLESFKIAGISVRTTNENGQAMTDIGNLWQRFFAENIISQIPDKMDDNIYSVYTDYISDYKGEYTSVIGCKVISADNLPTELTVVDIPSGDYKQFTAKGKFPDAIAEKWREIWEKDDLINRKYSADFEVYGPNSMNPENAEVEVFIAIK